MCRRKLLVRGPQGLSLSARWLYRDVGIYQELLVTCGAVLRRLLESFCLALATPLKLVQLLHHRL